MTLDWNSDQMVTVDPQPRVALIYPTVGLVVVCAALAVLSLRELNSNDVLEPSLLKSAVIFVVVFGSVYGGIGFRWWFRAGRTSYICDGQSLSAVRCGEVVVSVPCDAIKDLVLGPPMTVGDFFFHVLMDVPNLEVVVADSLGATQKVEFPPILIWGEDALESAESNLRSAVA